MIQNNNPTADTSVCEYLRRGWAPIPLPPRAKGPVLKGWTQLKVTEDDVGQYFRSDSNIGLLLGAPSGGLVDIDLDCPEARELAVQFLPPTPAITGRPSSRNSHWWYVAAGATTEKHTDPSTRDMIVELRATGCQTVVGPSMHPSGEPYDLLTGEPAVVPAPMLRACVAALAKAVIELRQCTATGPTERVLTRPLQADDTDVETRAIAYLDAIRAAVSGQGGHATTYTAATALVHGFGIPSERALQLLTQHFNPRCEPEWTEKELRHKIEDAATKPHDRPFGWLRDVQATEPTDVDLSQFRMTVGEEPEEPHAPPVADPGPIPVELLRVPGFVSEVMDHCLETAPYPNPALAFCGALALQAFLGGRKVRDQADNRTNIYLLALAFSAVGKDWPRKLNANILHQVALAGGLGDRFASGEGIQDSLFTTPCMLFQTDEIDGMLQSINKSQDARYENVMNTLLTMYSSANSVFPMRRKAGREAAGAIDQPCLVVHGSAIPNHYYQALSERMLTNGFFARMLVVESGRRAPGQEPRIREVPERVLATARWWADSHPGTGNLEHWHPVPSIVEYTDDARRELIACREECEVEYALAEESGDAVGTTVWGRANENSRKLALLYAISEDHNQPRIGRSAASWAKQLVMHQTKRMLFMAQQHVANDEFDMTCKKALRVLADWAKKRGKYAVMATWRFRQRMNLHPQRFKDMTFELEAREQIHFITIPGKTKPSRGYRLLKEN